MAKEFMSYSLSKRPTKAFSSMVFPSHPSLRVVSLKGETEIDGKSCSSSGAESMMSMKINDFN